MNFPEDIAVDSPGNVWVADSYNNRILEFRSPYSNGEAASIVLGQSGFTAYGASSSASGLDLPAGVAVDSSGNVWVSDCLNNRVLEFVKGSSGFKTGQAAALVLGQSSFATNTSATSITGMDCPQGLAFDSAGDLWVADSSNNRVLEFLKGSSGFTEGEAAALVLGQPGFTTGSAATTSSGFSDPVGVTIGPDGNLWVADNGNSRVLRFDNGSTGFSNGEAASLVLGQPNFTSSSFGGGKTGMYLPGGIAVTSKGVVWVADTVNCRVIGFINPTKNGQNASIVLGQPNFSDDSCNVASRATSQTLLKGPTDVAMGPLGNIWVTDGYNNRVVQFVSTSKTTLTCTPSKVTYGSQTTCTATVTDTAGQSSTPTGTVQLSSTPLGTFNATSCTLSGTGKSSSCSVEYTPLSGKINTTTANFEGDSNHMPSSDSFNLATT